MIKTIISAQYGKTSQSRSAGTTEVAPQAVMGIKSQGRNLAKVTLGSESLNVPQAHYVELLESKIDCLEKEIKKNQVVNRKLFKTLHSLESNISDLKKELKNKMDKF